MTSTLLFAKTPPVKLFFLASLPGAVSMLASALYQTLDGVFVGQYIGDTAFAAVNLAMPFVIINFSLADLIGVGAAVPIAVFLGKKQKENANNLFTCACLLIIAAGFLIGALLYATAPLLIRLMGADGEFASLAVDYMRVYALFSPLTTIIFAVDNFLRICGKIRFSMFLNILMSLLSGGLEWTFLAVFDGSVRSAACATCLGMAVCVLLAFLPFLRKKTLLQFRRPRFHAADLRQILACGSPNFLNNIAGRITSILLNLLLVRMGGETAVSVYGILMYADGFIQPLLYGMCDSLQPAVGFNWGAGQLSRVRKIESCCFSASAVVSLGAAAVLFFAPEPIIRLFVAAPTETVLAMALPALRLFSLTYLTRWFSFAVQSYLLAIEKSLPAAILSVCTALVFPVFLIGVLWRLALTGIWLNFAGTALLAGVLALVILRKYHKELSAPDKEPAEPPLAAEFP